MRFLSTGGSLLESCSLQFVTCFVIPFAKVLALRHFEWPVVELAVGLQLGLSSSASIQPRKVAEVAAPVGISDCLEVLGDEKQM